MTQKVTVVSVHTISLALQTTINLSMMGSLSDGQGSISLAPSTLRKLEENQERERIRGFLLAINIPQSVSFPFPLWHDFQRGQLTRTIDQVVQSPGVFAPSRALLLLFLSPSSGRFTNPSKGTRRPPRKKKEKIPFWRPKSQLVAFESRSTSVCCAICHAVFQSAKPRDRKKDTQLPLLRLCLLLSSSLGRLQLLSRQGRKKLSLVSFSFSLSLSSLASSFSISSAWVDDTNVCVSVGSQSPEPKRDSACVQSA